MIYITELAPSEPWRVTAELFDGVNVRLSWRDPRHYPQFVTTYLVYYVSTESTGTKTPAIVCAVFLLYQPFLACM